MPDALLLEEIKSLLRRDLKLGSTARIDDDMPLIGGELDLDSLDILLIVSSLEKHFQIKIPNEVVGRWAFQNVSTLAKFVEENRGASKRDAHAPRAESQQWLERLPHGPEFRFITRMRDVAPGKSARGEWVLDGSEWFFKAHFPGNPVVPGVLLIEALAQVVGLAASVSPDDHGGALVHADVKFERPITPPATIDLSARVARTMDQLHLCDVEATVSGTVVARGRVTIKLSSR